MRPRVFPLEVVKKLGGLGYMGAIFPEELGGAGLGYIEYSIIIEELSRVDGSVGIIVAAHTSLCSNHIFKFGSDEQRRRYIPKLATGEWIGCWSLTEPEAGSDAAGTRTTAVRRDACWELNGAKTFTTNAHYADVCVAMAVTNRAGVAARHLGLHHREGHARLPAGQEGEQAGVARQRHRRGDLRELRAAGRPPAGAGGRRLRGQPAGCSTAGASPSPRSPSAWRRAPTTPRCAIPSCASSSGGRSPSSSRSRTSSSIWRWTSTPRACSTTALRGCSTTAGASPRNPPWRSCSPPRRRCASRTSACRFTAATASSRTTRRRSIYRDVKLCTIGEGTSEIQRLVIARQLLKN